jgi:hypothetical protein
MAGESFDIWYVQDHPPDLPYAYVAKVLKDSREPPRQVSAGDLDELRRILRHRGLVRAEFADEQLKRVHPTFVEAWSDP